MTHFLDHYTLRYTPLSPVHIGTDESYEPTNYIIDDNTLYEFDIEGAINALTAKDRSELDKIVSKPNAQMIKSVQKFFYDKRDALKPWAINTIPVLEGVANFYNGRVGKVVNHESGGGEVINNLEINRCAYNSINRQPLLFGSSIKGAIRTALLNHVNKGQALNKTTDRRTGKLRSEDNRELQQRLLKFQAGKFELDPLRLVSVGDANWVNQDDLPKSKICMTVNRKKHKVVDGNGVERPSQSEGNQGLNKLLEYVPAWRYRAFSGQLTLQDINSIRANVHSSKLPESKLCYSMADIAKICSSFYLPKLKEEVRLMRDREFVDKEWDKSIQRLIASIIDQVKNGQVFLLRIGRHSGAESVTLNGEGVRNIKILQGKDPVTGRQNFTFDDKTKTLWLAAQHKEQRTDLLPFGWVLVQVENNGVSSELPLLNEICSSQHSDDSIWAQKLAQEKTQYLEIRNEAIERRKQEDIKRLEEAEISKAKLEAAQQKELEEAAQAELKRQEEQTRLAQLPKYLQDIAELLKAKKDPNKKDYLVLIDAVKAGQWEGSDKQLVLEDIQTRMQELKEWRPTTNKKDPSKDKEHTRTIEVIKLKSS